jgi:methionyl-tRNA formyltransferase
VNTVYLTTDDPIYLPSFFDSVLAERDEPASVFVVPPLYGRQSTAGAAWRYLRTFGGPAAWGLTTRVVGAKLRHQSIANVCERHGVLCEPVRNVNQPAFLERLRLAHTELIVSVSCPQIFKKPLIDLPPAGCLNIHGAILPEYRGVMPSFWMLANGEREAGVSIFFVDEDIDAGDLCGQEVFEIRAAETLDEFVRRSKAIAAELLLDVLGQIDEGVVQRTPLDLSEGSYYSWPDREAVRRFGLSGHKLWGQ